MRLASDVSIPSRLTTAALPDNKTSLMVRASSNTVGLRTHTSFLGETVLIGTIFPCDEDDPDVCDGAGRKTLSLPVDFFVDAFYQAEEILF